MIESDIIMPMKFDDPNFFIISTNSTYASKLMGEISSNSWGC